MRGKDDGDYDSPTSRDETLDEKKRKKRGHKKREKAQIKKRREKIYERKRERGHCYYPFTTLVLQSSTMIFMIESLSVGAKTGGSRVGGPELCV